MTIKKRLDQKVQELAPDQSRRQVQSWIMQGKISVDGRIVTKPGFQVGPKAIILVNVEEPKYVSRAGFKLEKALDHFGLDVQDFIVLDAGISTGGFTDCLLQRGAKKIYGIDVGYGQVHEKIRNNSRVMVRERTNLRELESVGELVDLVTLDLSFISILKVMETVVRVLKPGGHLIVLIKPQFEAGKHDVGRGGIVSDPLVHQRVVDFVTHGIREFGFEFIGVTDSPITGADGNKEFLAYFRKL